MENLIYKEKSKTETDFSGPVAKLLKDISEKTGLDEKSEGIVKLDIAKGEFAILSISGPIPVRIGLPERLGIKPKKYRIIKLDYFHLSERNGSDVFLEFKKDEWEKGIFTRFISGSIYPKIEPENAREIGRALEEFHNNLGSFPELQHKPIKEEEVTDLLEMIQKKVDEVVMGSQGFRT